MLRFFYARAIGTASRLWILATAYWNDDQVWDDDAEWQD